MKTGRDHQILGPLTWYPIVIVIAIVLLTPVLQWIKALLG